MPHSYETVLGPVTWQADDASIAFSVNGRRSQAEWDEITAAGLAESAMSPSQAGTPPSVLSGLSKYLPGLGKLTEINEHLADNYRTLILARGPSHARAIRVPIPLASAEAAALVEEVERQVAGRWAGEVELGQSYTGLGIRRP